MPTPAQNLATNSDKVAYTSYYPTDKIVICDSSSSAVSSQSYSNVGAELLPVAIYTTDGGVDWQDCVASSSITGFTLSTGTTECFSYLSGSDVVFNFSRFGGSPNNGAKWVGLAKSDTVFTNKYISSGKSSYNTTVSYMKIALEGSYFKASGSGTSTTTIAHNLGYMPMVNVWIKDTTYFSPAAWRRPFCQGDTSAISEAVRVDSTNIYITTNQATDTTVYYRIYYEN